MMRALARSGGWIVFAFVVSLPSCSTSSGSGGNPVAPPTTGAVRVQVSTTGEDLDTDGYELAVSGQGARSIGINETLVLEGLPPGETTVGLSAVAENCAVGGENPRSVTVVAGSTASVVFEVRCERLMGTLEVTVRTTGVDPDPDGYTVQVGALAEAAVAANGSVTIEVPRGTHAVELLGVAANCAVDGEARPEATVEAGGVARLAFDVVCRLGGRIVLSRPDPNAGGGSLNPAGPQIPVQHDLWVVDPDGANLRRLTDTPETEMMPAWSPDGTRIAFFEAAPDPEDPTSFDVSLRVMNADGTGERIVFADPSAIFQGRIAWSPDGARIAFTMFVDRDPADIFDDSAEIFVVGADGTGLRQLTDRPGIFSRDPTWSPDGSEIVFASPPDGDPFAGNQLLIMRADGSNRRPLVPGPAGFPDWAPGPRIAFFGGSIWTVDPDGTNARRLTDHPFDFDPSWSPYGPHLVFERCLRIETFPHPHPGDPDGTEERCTALDLMFVEADGTGLQRLASFQIPGGLFGGLSPDWGR